MDHLRWIIYLKNFLVTTCLCPACDFSPMHSFSEMIHLLFFGTSSWSVAYLQAMCCEFSIGKFRTTLTGQLNHVVYLNEWNFGDNCLVQILRIMNSERVFHGYTPYLLKICSCHKQFCQSAHSLEYSWKINTKKGTVKVNWLNIFKQISMIIFAVFT